MDKMVAEPENTLRSIAVTFLKQVGMHAQARNVAKNPHLEHMSPLELVEQLKKFNVTYTIDIPHQDQLEDTHYPFIGITSSREDDGEYHATLFRRSGKTFQKQTPASRRWQAVDFEEISQFSHIVVLESIPSKQLSVRTFVKEVNLRKKWYWPVLVLTFMSTLTGLSIPLFTMSVYDKVIGGHLVEVLPELGMGAAIAVFIYVGARLARGYILSKVVTEFVREISNVTFHRLIHMPLTLLARVGITNHINRMKNTERVRSMLAGTVGGSMLDLPFVIIVLITIAVLAGWLVLVPIVMILLHKLVSYLLTKFTNAALPAIYNEHQDGITELSKNILFLKSGGNAEGWIQRLHRLNRENSRQNFMFAKRNGLYGAVSHVMTMITGLVTIFVGIFLVLNHSITSGALIACVMLIWRITGPAAMVLSSSLKIDMLKSAVAQFDGFLTVQTENNELRLDIPDMDSAPAVSFKGVTLRYDAESAPALSGVEFDALAGDVVAVLGPNGCGKSSLLITTLGVLEPQAGYISLNGRNIRQYDPQVYRTWCSYSPAETQLVEGSLADNIRFQKPSATDEEIVAALQQAGAHALLELVEGDIHAPIFAACNIMLRSIDAEAISLARVIVSDSNFILMDEPVAAGNPTVKAAFIEFIKSCKGTKTLIFSTHDQHLLPLVDKVVVLDKGAVAFAGPLPEQAPVENQGEANA
ncbi:peptidase domain-containing ABC transporter [Vibrio ezurae]|uniref:Putative ABC transporter permease/ATP-binding protein n=1 Tax=Vibrio ezurae NBRC 102218 TaxID=1219080 RepID=U3CPW8_9VIBR|nr:ATP-binding cassette domain-containing protein [Vibrio ezurae]GAD80213.1 putative ABC transporter permease/ATP-binding protein [Vibrio ezurae NBRC 102218]